MFQPHESLSGMGVVSRAVNKLPTWVRMLLLVLAVPVMFYEIVRYGFWTALLRLIFSPAL